MENGKNYFRSLAPDNNAENVGNYAAWLHSVATDSSTNQDYGNIALTGDIGIGKSSIVRTYEKNKNYKFVYITAGDLGYRFEKDEITGLPLLSLKKEKANDNSADEQEENAADGQAESEKSAEKSDEAEQDEIEKLSEEIQQKLEKNLLEQLIALCSSKDIPKSRFQTVPENESTADKRFWQIIYPIFCVIAAFCGFKLIANNFIEKDYIDFIDFVPIMWLILIIFFSLSIGVAVSKLITHYKFTKITLNVGKEDNGGASAEIDIDEGENASLDTNLHEIIYLFEQLAKKKRLFKWRKPVFVIEDVDRYPAEICFPILTKFKQINDMLNSRYRLNHSGYGKHFKFIYTLNDKIFDDSQGGRSISDNDPYKFFDVIIPVIPKLSFANSYSILINDFEDYKIDKGFLKDVSFYIFDFRKLRDIENEFEVYYDKFKEELDIAKTDSNESSGDKKKPFTTTVLLAFVMYKIFYKGEYYKLFRTNKQGAPISSLMKKYLGLLGEEMRDVDKLEGILEGYFEEYIGKILEIDGDIEKQYRGAVIAEDKDVDVNSVVLKNTIFRRQDLRYRDFSGKDLSGLDFRLANLADAHFEYAHLEDAHLEDAFLLGANLYRTHLEEANLKRAHLEGAHLKLAHLEGAHLNEAVLEGANLWGANLFGAHLEGATLAKANLKRGILLEANLENTVLFGADFEYAKYNEATIWKGARYDFDTILPKGTAYITDVGMTGPKDSIIGADKSVVINSFLTEIPEKRPVASGECIFNGVIIDVDDLTPQDHGMILDLRGDNLGNMDLRGKDLSNALLQGTNLEYIKYDDTTKWTKAMYDFHTIFPDGFKPEEHDMILDLRYEDLRNMDLRGKDLSNALLHGANLENVIYDETTIWKGAKYNKDTKFPKSLNYIDPKYGLIPD